MADLTEVASKLVQVIAAAVYPNGTAQPSITGAPVLVYQGWPNPQQLTDGLKAGKVHISVFPRPGDKVTSVTAGDAEWVEQSNDGTTGVSTRELRRQTRQFQITIWANCFETRDPMSSAVDIALATVTRIDFPDGSQGLMAYVNSTQDDNQQNQGIYRRDLFYSVNYATVQTSMNYNIKQTDLNYSIGPTLDAQGDTHTITNP